MEVATEVMEAIIRVMEGKMEILGATVGLEENKEAEREENMEVANIHQFKVERVRYMRFVNNFKNKR